MNHLYSFVVVISSASFFLMGCTSAPKNHSHSDKSVAPVYYAVAHIKPTEGNSISGEVHFSEGFGEVKIVARIQGLPPNSEHGFHIHEYGDCRAPNASSAGGHYNPTGHQHGGPESDAKHVGDLGNLKSNKKGEANLKITIRGMSLLGSVSPVLGRGVIVHKNPDDLISQPTGGAGDRIGCGIIGAAEKLKL